MKKKSRRKGVKPKQKGSSWELKLANQLTDRTGQEFRRVPLSGAWMGGMNRQKNIGVLSGAQESLSGDIMGPDGWPFSIECKNTRDYPRFHLMLQDRDKTIDGYILESMTDGFYTGKIPLVSLKRTRRGEYMLIPEVLMTVGMKHDLPPPESYPHMTYIYKDPQVYGDEKWIPTYSYIWILVNNDFFVHNVFKFWEAGKEVIEESQDLDYFRRKVSRGLEKGKEKCPEKD